jgi:hypothetical protein
MILEIISKSVCAKSTENSESDEGAIGSLDAAVKSAEEARRRSSALKY